MRQPLLLRLPSRLACPRWHVGIRRTLATHATAPSPNDPFADGTNAYYAEEMYRHWRQDPSSVHPSWNAYFSGLDKGLPSHKAFQPPPKRMPSPTDGAPALFTTGGAELDDHLRASLFTRSCRVLILSLGSTAGSSIPSPRTSPSRARPVGHS
jgi:2-oxoglutarate dehydrogenase E1 component